jgi:hypothetical protein
MLTYADVCRRITIGDLVREVASNAAATTSGSASSSSSSSSPSSSRSSSPDVFVQMVNFMTQIHLKQLSGLGGGGGGGGGGSSSSIAAGQQRTGKVVADTYADVCCTYAVRMLDVC